MLSAKTRQHDLEKGLMYIMMWCWMYSLKTGMQGWGTSLCRCLPWLSASFFLFLLFPHNTGELAAWHRSLRVSFQVPAMENRDYRSSSGQRPPLLWQGSHEVGCHSAQHGSQSALRMIKAYVVARVTCRNTRPLFFISVVTSFDPAASATS